MAIQEASIGLGFSTDLIDPGVPVSITLDGSFDVSAGIVQILELTVALELSAGLIAQGADSGLSVTAMLDGDSTRQEGKSIHNQPYKVIGLSHPTPEGRLFEAREAPGVPLDGAAHPVEAGIQVISKRARFQSDQDATRAIVDVTWGLPLSTDLTKGGGITGKGVLSLSPTAFVETTWLDKDGAFMEIRYQAGNLLATRLVSTEFQRNTWTATLTKEFDTPQYGDMLRPSQINSEPFGPFGARQLLFLGPTMQETDDGKYTHGYQMTFNPKGWELRATIWINGFAPLGATEVHNPLPFFGGTGDGSTPGGLGVFFIYDEFDFAELPVAFP